MGWANVPCSSGNPCSKSADEAPVLPGKWTTSKRLMDARSNIAAAGTPGGEWAAFAGGNSNVNPVEYFSDPACRCHCQPKAKFFPAAEQVTWGVSFHSMSRRFGAGP